MNDLQTPVPGQLAASPSPEQFESLRQLVNTVLILTVLVSGTLTVFLYRQYTLVHAEVEAVRQEYNTANARYQQLRPKMEDFEKRIADYARAHRDFAQILAKYAPRQATAPAPGPAKR